jgi:hypothetical protein
MRKTLKATGLVLGLLAAAAFGNAVRKNMRENA